MTTFLLILSFLLHGVTILVLITMAQRLKTSEELEKRQQNVSEEIEQLFTAYLMEIKEENERLQYLLDSSEQHSFTGKESQPPKTEKEKKSNPVISSPEKEGYHPPLPDEDTIDYRPSLQTQIIALRKIGESTESIAKQLNLGKTETELFLKFNERKM
ncbi:hypothetical protein [Thalassobacillus pellis]|uniref:hypothetical protein n=1 Tax=Thalassobacillus pellis TaxID=748008 RepID=UPI0019615CCC|nr:hypothetical protein [Thalassobacillus pellis]MBM7552723.1 hypothetical protein [Thalassobacillus pellis]